ncbi:mesoderm posterior aa [Pimephales promelas]|uniref:mesoderm posterior aa n=1 Tax=Pimephales promelas TaxID=90988 RepID=UPI0019558A9B|nr:mesoderm posterior aa [Pimephales promelas]XP_039514314.1 mesoderm posterior aa [Pimephales promelas]KAG1959454.1 mesoderm posterior protein [Pimephales promelas]
MDISSSALQLQDNCAFLFGCENILDPSYSVSDAGYYSAGSSLSPTSSIDSCGFSPPAYSCGVGHEILQIFPLDRSTTQEKSKGQPPKRTGRPRSKFPGVKRETASEREKLRMRDLTKALQHLRTYLPPSVAPAGKTLTKIETLRLTIQYISSLSAQLEFSEDEANRGNQAEVVTASTMFDNFNFCAAPSVPQSLPAQQFPSMTCYQTQNPVEGDFLSFPAQDFWIPQQHNFFHGQC